MKTPTGFLERVAQIIGANTHDQPIEILFRWNNYEESKLALSQIANMLRELRLLRHELSLRTKELRQLYGQKLSHIDQLASEEDQSSRHYDRRISAQIDSDMRRTVRVERSDALSPYRGVGRTLAAVDLQLRTIQSQVLASPEYLSRPSRSNLRVSSVGHQYYVRIGDERKGPLSAEQVRGLIKIGMLSPEDQVQVEGIAVWIAVSSVNELGDAFSDQQVRLPKPRALGPFLPPQCPDFDGFK